MASNRFFQAILAGLKVVGKPDRKGNYTAFCPFHDDQRHPNLKVHPDRGFRCFTCGAKGSVVKLAEHLGLTAKAEEGATTSGIRNDAEAMELLRQRGLRDETIAHFQIMPDIEKQAWRYPVTYQGEVKAWRYKRFPGRHGGKNWWAESGATFLVYGLDDVQGGAEVWLMEGEPDTWIASQCGLKVITFLGGARYIPTDEVAEQLREAGIKRLNLVYHRDGAGQEGSRSVADALTRMGFDVIMRAMPIDLLPDGKKDLNDLYQYLDFNDARFREMVLGLEQASSHCEIRILHPALEIRSDVALVGFREQVVDGDDIRSRNIFLVSMPSGIKIVTGSTIDLPQGKGVLNVKGKVLPLASERADLAELMSWAKDAESPDFSKVYGEIQTILKHYIFMPEPAYSLVSAWVMGTYFYYSFGAYPFLLFLGLKETGKSNTLCLLSRLCFNAYRAAYLSSPALADTTDSLRGTLLLDQANLLSGKEDLLSLLADSYKREGGRRRVVTLTRNGRRVDEFDSFSPKAFASIESLPDDLADRCFTIHMAPALGIVPDPSASKEDWRKVRTDLYKLLLTQHGQVCELVSQDTGEGSRFGELWLPIWVMLTSVRETPERIKEVRAFCAEKFAQVRFELDEWDAALVSSALDAPEEVAADALLASVIESIGPAEGDKRPGAKWLGRALMRLGLLRKKSRRRDGSQQKRYYLLDKVQAERLFSRSLQETVQTEQRDIGYEDACQIRMGVPSETAHTYRNDTLADSGSQVECAVVPSVPFTRMAIPSMLWNNVGGVALVRMKYMGDQCYFALDDDWAKLAPESYPTYTLAEVEVLSGRDEGTKRMVHEAKKLAGAKIIT